MQSVYYILYVCVCDLIYRAANASKATKYIYIDFKLSDHK